MMTLQEAIREMYLYAEDDNYGPDVGRWLMTIEQAMREPEAWKSIDREGIEDATVYEDTMQDWVRFGRRIVPLFAFPPDAAGEIERLTMERDAQYEMNVSMIAKQAEQEAVIERLNNRLSYFEAITTGAEHKAIDAALNTEGKT